MKPSLHQLKLTQLQFESLKAHLFPGDGLEAGAIALCGWRQEGNSWTLYVHKLFPLDHGKCERTETLHRFPVEMIVPELDHAAKRDLAVVKFHSHPNGYDRFSEVDDASDPVLFRSIHDWVEGQRPHGSCVMLPDGKIFGRLHFPDEKIEPISRFCVAGSQFRTSDEVECEPQTDEQARTAQTFGNYTTQLLSTLSVGVVGCSGTGSHVIEQLVRLGVGRLVIVDPDRIERRNINRIVGSTTKDVDDSLPKVEMFANHIKTIGLNTVVDCYHAGVEDPAALRALSGTDFVFGCTDNKTSRDVVGKLAAHYLIPVVDVGVRVNADGIGGISVMCGSVHYMTPDGPSLLDRGAITSDMLYTESLRRQSPEQYKEQLDEGYIRGANVESPPVISLNGTIASLGVMEFLNRIHPYRDGNNGEGSWQLFDFEGGHMEYLSIGTAAAYKRYVGLGDQNPPLSSPGLGS